MGLAARRLAVLVPGPRIEPTFLAMAGGFFTTGPPGKSQDCEILIPYKVVNFIATL